MMFSSSSSASSFVVIAAAALLLLLSLVESAPSGDLITNLPGYKSGQTPSKQYSGYINVNPSGTGRFIHYWFVESENQPATDPIFLWLNGVSCCV